MNKAFGIGKVNKTIVGEEGGKEGGVVFRW